ncbi:hypothetical protein SKAU_G00351540 [Synaphobranchus kaupii]|uniref:Peptidase C19 ubiquitin carboxyl-terminal hydrolase domain-containing protein n=1 Tax=Synaphobranchus kaupii TaxID=118154 RepID=A0A9Q1EKK4_SYNKA|nr:hypothetical protein SKAU_G00351540 [Synaphobranchus kaupii]
MFILYSLLFHRLEFQSSRKIQEEHISQDKYRRNRIDHTVLGFPNIGNTCLQIFIQDIRREESCWRSNLTTHLLKCLADLQSARASCSRERKISLLKTLKRTIAANYSDFCGDEHCGDKVSKTESYNCLSVDLVPEGSTQDRLAHSTSSAELLLLCFVVCELCALLSPVCEVECQCHWCYGQLASVEQKLQSLPQVLVVQLKRFSLNSRGDLVKLHDRLHIAPQFCLQAHSRVNVHRAGMPKPHLTQGDCYETYFSPEGAVPFTGHYICENSKGNTTWLFDDEGVQQMDQVSALRRRSNLAYTLFYEYRGAGG